MGRIDDALRRAAEAADHEGTTAPVGTGMPENDVATLSRESFPVEIADRRTTLRSVSSPAPAVAQQATTPPPVRTSPDATQSAFGRIPTKGSGFDRIDASLTGKIVVGQEIAPSSVEQYRRLAATLHHAQAAHGLKVVMVTSALMGEGKTLTVSNLALTLSESYKKNVLLIDGDLRRPALHTLFHLENSPGLSECLLASDEHKVAVRQVSPRLGVLTAGHRSSDPIAGLTSPRMQRLIEEARDTFDWVLIDTPPVALLPDANLLTSMADGALLVVKAGQTAWDLAQRAVQTIGRERVLGVVLNQSVASTPGAQMGEDEYFAKPTPAEVPPAQ